MKKVCLVIAGLFVLLVALGALIAFVDEDSLKGIGRDKVALIRIEGIIIDSSGPVKDIKGYADEPSIKAIVIRVDSPGGVVAPSQEIYDEVKKASKIKTVVASMGALAASGGYYISAPATRIVANPGTLTGSIGVIMELPNIKGLMDKIGVKTEIIKTGKFKDMASASRGLTDEERERLQELLDDVHLQFIEAVAEGRDLPVEAVALLADGSIYTGRQAVENGLVDELGTLQDAIMIAARLAGIEGEPMVVTKKKKLSLIDLLRGEFKQKIEAVYPSMTLKFMMTY